MLPHPALHHQVSPVRGVPPPAATSVKRLIVRYEKCHLHLLSTPCAPPDQHIAPDSQRPALPLHKPASRCIFSHMPKSLLKAPTKDSISTISWSPHHPHVIFATKSVYVSDVTDTVLTPCCVTASERLRTR
ncbi:hypothetical protein EVAR_91243_1 [Eumeta japonica]|uniref:Uncharacterized protein n=1 Tax=Eumeta variegata TaxID=151549 RepID=A0A4C2A2S3_EUMVA|nr:hypothetical protein EVAR_91243_1 [Eumeta japonica]